MHYRAPIVLMLLLTLLAGCGYPAAQPRNQRLISSLRTALSARNPDWLQDNVEAIEARHSSGEMDDSEYAAFQQIIAQAKSGQWAEAERASVKFQQAQRPTREQLDRLVQPVQ